MWSCALEVTAQRYANMIYSGKLQHSKIFPGTGENFYRTSAALRSVDRRKEVLSQPRLSVREHDRELGECRALHGYGVADDNDGGVCGCRGHPGDYVCVSLQEEEEYEGPAGVFGAEGKLYFYFLVVFFSTF